ncbi:MAG: hypothetical protein LBQ79_00210 [Deltaproteobacteria bacterium]|jgi:hypothetical protein|nr:hypothetical protein [Deltaproteobacteria bacterium]
MRQPPARENAPPAPPTALAAAATVLALLALSAPAPSQDEGTRIYRDQKPMTRADMPAVMELARFHFGTLSEWEATRLSESLGTDEDRLMYLTARIEVALELLGPDPPTEDEVAASRGTRRALPSPAELELIRGVEGELRALIPAGAREPGDPAAGR